MDTKENGFQISEVSDQREWASHEPVGAGSGLQILKLRIENLELT